MDTTLFEPLFEFVESNLYTKTNMTEAARTVSLSPVHLTRHPGGDADYSRYLTSIEANDNPVPDGNPDESGTSSSAPATDFFGGCPCIKFHYLGKHHYRELSQQTAKQMYRAIRKHVYGADAAAAIDGRMHLEKIDAAECNGEYCLMEWYAPVKEEHAGGRTADFL